MGEHRSPPPFFNPKRSPCTSNFQKTQGNAKGNARVRGHLLHFCLLCSELFISLTGLRGHEVKLFKGRFNTTIRKKQNSLQILTKYNVTYTNLTEILSYLACSREIAWLYSCSYTFMVPTSFIARASKLINQYKIRRQYLAYNVQYTYADNRGFKVLIALYCSQR